MLLRRTALTMILAAATAMAADSGLLKLLATDPAMLSGLNVEAARGSAFGQRVLAQMKTEDANFQKMIEATGFDPRKDLYEVLAASDGKTGFVAARGNFQPAKLGALLVADGAQTVLYQGVEIWVSKTGSAAVAIPDSGLALFGQLDQVKSALDRRTATKSALSADLQTRVAQWSGYDAWFVSTIGLSELGANKAGKTTLLPQGVSAEMIRSGAAGVTFSTDIKVAGAVTTRSTTDAESLVDLYRFVLSLMQMNSDKQGAAEVLKVAETAIVTASGINVNFSLTIPDTMLNTVFERKTATRRADHHI